MFDMPNAEGFVNYWPGNLPYQVPQSNQDRELFTSYFHSCKSPNLDRYVQFIMSSNRDAVILPAGSAKSLANYPHARLISASSRTLYISGTSSRLADASFEGFETNIDGTPSFDVGKQTAAILRNIEAVIKQATDGKGGLHNLIDVTVFLTDREYYSGMNKVWNEFWPDYQEAPARTTIAVKALPSPKMVVEMKCTAVV